MGAQKTVQMNGLFLYPYLCLMKTLPLFVLLMVLSIAGLTQNDKITEALFKTPNIVVEQGTTQHGDGVRTSQSALIFAEENEFSKAWKKYIKTNYGIEGKRDNGFYGAQQVVSTPLSPDTISFFYKIEKEGDFIRLTTLVKQGNEYPTTTPVFQNVQAMMEKAIYEFYVELYDEKMSSLQKNYDRQVKDLEKVEKQGDRLEKDKASHEKSIDKLTSDISGLRTDISKISSNKKPQEKELELEKKEYEQKEKEIKTLESDLKEAELSYNTKLASGELSEKKAEKGLSDIVKRREKISKLQDKLTSKNTQLTKTENAIIQSDRKLSETQNSLEKKEAEITSHRNDIEKLREEIQANKDNIQEEKLQVETAKVDLEKLKLAKGGMTLLRQ